ncbi:hypothetical protein SAMN06298216_2100 [Spirosomataceae bacterium TFI 002]|nr:hypothetical protein SAMN06298216_2100 [Spirosomataceae bacterium TFI 002]
MLLSKTKYCLLVLSICTQIAFAQKPKLTFLQDSIGLGKVALVSMTYTHGADLDVFFAQSPDLFKPFELVGVEALETKTTGGQSTDSVIYSVKTFEVNPIQTLQLPIWQIIDGDSSRIMSNLDTLLLKFLIPDSLLATADFKTRSSYIPTKSKLNYPLLLRWLIGLFSFVAFFFLFLKRPLERLLLKWRFRQKHYRFTQQFRKAMKTAEELPASLDLWKKHMEWLDDRPYTTLSTSEITKQSGDERLGEALKEIDGAIYGGIVSDRILIALQILHNYALDKFQIKRRNYYKSLK